MLPRIPADFEEIMARRFIESVYEALRDFIEAEIKKLAEDQQIQLNADLAVAKVGGSFLGQPIIATTKTTITLFVRFVEVSVPLIPGLKLRLARAAIEMERWVNLTTSSEPRLNIRDVPAYAVEVLQKTDNYEISLGGGKDAGFKQFRVGIRWAVPEIMFRGYLAQRDKGGFLIDVAAGSEFAIPIGPSGFGLLGARLLYGEHFAPDLRDPGSIEDVIARMERATAQDYVDWVHRNDLEKWWPVDQNVRVYGIQATVCDMLSSGSIISVADTGIAYIDYGPVVIFGGRLRILETGDAGEITGVIDVRSKSIFARSSFEIKVIPWAPDAIILRGVQEVSASLKEQDQTWWAMGGYAMDGSRLKILDFLELWGGMRVVPLQGASVRAGGRIEGKIEFIGTGGGFSLSIDVNARFGWNPFELGGSLTASGEAWLKIFGAKLGVGIYGKLAVQIPEPLYLRLDVEFRMNMPWPLKDKRFPATIFRLERDTVHAPASPIAIENTAPLSYVHGPSGTMGQLTTTSRIVWPDVSFDLPFQRIASGPRSILNPPPLAGVHDEAGISVSHAIDRLEITKLDPAGGEVLVPGVAASWLIGRHGERTHLMNRLAIPCNDPLGWSTTFEHAQPDTVEPQEMFRLQTFGAGHAEDFDIDPATNMATIVVEHLLINSRRALSLLAVPWAGRYGRVLTGSDLLEIAICGPEVGATTPLSIKSYELRILCTGNSEPNLVVNEGTVEGAIELQRFENGSAEWAVTISRQKSEYLSPLEVSGFEREIRLLAVGYVLDALSDVDGGTITILAPGNYRLRVEGKSVARRGKHDAKKTWASIVRDFQVIQPPLRPYLKFSTFGDERIFGLSMTGWNPNPQGSGFGHYQDHLGVIRAKVSYLSKIYQTLWISPREGVAPIALVVKPARDGTLAGSRASQDWEIATGGAPKPEEELEVSLPPVPGIATVSIYFSAVGDGSDIDLAVPLDHWTYRVSEYRNPTAHLKPVYEGISWTFGPSGPQRLQPVHASPLPGGFDFGTSPPAKATAGWLLPAAVGKLADIKSPDASLSFLRLLEWAGIFNMRVSGEENILNAPADPDLSIVRDGAASPIGLLLRVREPCDWRRVDVSIVAGDLTGIHCKFETRLVPSSDGCACLFLLEAEDTAMRVPSGTLALELRYFYAKAGLPRLTVEADAKSTSEIFAFTFVQPFGPAWSV